MSSVSDLVIVSAQAYVHKERLKNEWNTPVYAFFSSTPMVEYVDQRQSHILAKVAKEPCGASWIKVMPSQQETYLNTCAHAKVGERMCIIRSQRQGILMWHTQP
jgi:hypothetical protein